MNLLSSHEFHALCHDNKNTLLKTTYNRPKLFENQQGEMIKIFYPRNKKFSSNQRDPYALRFCRNATKLKQLGILAPAIATTAYCQQLETYVITYRKVSGTDVRVLSEQQPSIIKDVAAYLAELHQKGIFFRSIHLENILQLPNKTFALLDIVDVQFKSKPLSTYLRFRNLKHIVQTKDDKAFWSKYGIKNFINDYLHSATLSIFSKKILGFLKIINKL